MFKGTAKELVARGVQIEGVEVDAVSLSVLAKFKLVSVVGKVPSPTGKGKPSSIYEISPLLKTTSTS